MFGGDEVGALVLDIGTAFVRAGFAGEDTPKAVFSTSVGIGQRLESKDDLSKAETSPSSLSSLSSKQTTKKSKQFFVGHQARHRRDNMEIQQPVQHGLVNDWDLIDQILDYTFKKHLSVEPKDHPLMVAEPVFNTPVRREKLAEMLFESFSVPAMFLCKSACLAAFSVGRSTALVLDSGAGVTTAVPVHDGYVLTRGIRKTKVAGDIVDQAIEKLVFDGKELPCRHEYRRSVDASGAVKCTKLDAAAAPCTKSFQRLAQYEVIRDIKESLCRVLETPFDETMKVPAMQYELPDGKVIDLSHERFACPEILFAPNPSLVDIKDDLDATWQFEGLDKMVEASVKASDVDIQKELYGSVVLTGGNTLFPGLPARLQKDLMGIVPPSAKVKLVQPPSASERKFGVWVGGSIIGSLGSFHQMWFSRAEYDEQGAAGLLKKCP